MPLPKKNLKSYRERYQEKMMKPVLNGEARYLEPDDGIVLPFKEFVYQQLGANKCYTLSDLKTGEYQEWYRIKDVFGYSNEEFTACAVNNDSFSLDHFIWKEHVDHKIRYSEILFEILASDIKFIKRKDYYSVTFKLKHKEGYYVSVKRRSFIFRAAVSEGILTRLDEWELMGRQEISYVYPEFFMHNTVQMAELNKILYFRNLELLELQMNERMLQVLHLKLKGYTDLQIGRIYNLSGKKIERYFGEVSIILRNRFGNDKLKGIQQIRTLAKTWGLYPVPGSLLPDNDLLEAAKIV